MRTRGVMAGACLAVGLFAGGQLASAQSVAYLAGNCTTCHGPDGRTVGETPELAGLSPAYFVEQIALFRDGKRKGTIMNQIAKGYTEAEIAALADWFSRQKPSRGEAPK